MSLIQEALKRQNEDSGDPVPGGQPTVPADPDKPHSKLSVRHAPSPESVPVADQAFPPPDGGDGGATAGATRRKWLKLGGIAAGCIVMAAIGGGAWFAISSGTFKDGGTADSAAATTPDPELKAAFEVKGSDPAPEPPAALVSPTITTPVATTEATPTIDVTTAPVSAEETASAWPLLSLSGTGGSGKRAFAIINKNLVRVGDTIDGVKVVRVGLDTVELEFDGGRQTVKVGGSTR